MNRLLHVALLIIPLGIVGCLSTVSTQQRFDKMPVLRREYVPATNQTLYSTRPVSLQSEVKNLQARSLSLHWSIGCDGASMDQCSTDFLRLNLYSTVNSVPRFLNEETRRLRLEADGQLIYDGVVFYAEPRADGQFVHELMTAPFPIVAVHEATEEEGGFTVRRMIDPLPSDSLITLSSRSTLEGTIGEFVFKLMPVQLAPLAALADTVAALGQ